MKMARCVAWTGIAVAAVGFIFPSSVRSAESARRMAAAIRPSAVRGAKDRAAKTGRSKLNTLPVAGSRSRITMDFRDAPIDQILNFFSVTSGLTFIKDPGLTGSATLITPRPIPVKEAFEILGAFLDSRGYRLERTAVMVRILPKGNGAGSERRGGADRRGEGEDGGGRFGFGGRGQEQTQVFQLRHASAKSIATIVNDLFKNVPGAGGAGRAQDRRWNNRNNNAGNNNENNNANGENNAPPTPPPSARASSDDYSNSVVVTGPAAQIEQIRQMIEQIDQPVGSTQATQVFPIQYLDATDMAGVVSNVLIATSTGGAGAGAAGNIPFERRAWMAARAGASAATSGQVAAHAETNSLIVTASEESLNLIEGVIKELDKPQQIQATTFVRSMNNASAAEVATLLQQMYGRRSGLGMGGGNFGGGYGVFGNGNWGSNLNNNRNNRNRNNRIGNGNFGGGFGFNSNFGGGNFNGGFR